MRWMACDMNVSEKTMGNIVKVTLKFSPLKMQTQQHLINLQKEKTLAQAKILFNKMKACTDMAKITFSDEKLFTVKAICKQQNDRVLTKSSTDIPDSMRRVFRCQKFSFSMVWTIIFKPWKSPLIFVPQDAKVNTNPYIETILTPALQEAKKHFKNKPFTFQQYGASSHMSK